MIREKRIFFVTFIALGLAVTAMAGERFNFNAGWKVQVGKEPKASGTKYDDSSWQTVTLPWSFNQTEAFAKPIAELSDTVMWYRKHFVLPENLKKGRRFFIEFEGVRFGARVFLNGKELGWSDNGVMAFGFDLTPYIKKNDENILSVYVDNNWKYKEHFKTWSEKAQKEVRSGFQWNDKNFYCNYGGINKNVWLHVMYSDVYQTLPLYSNLQTTGVYVYATDHDIQGRSAVIHAESEVMNESAVPQQVGYQVQLFDKDGQEVASFQGDAVVVAPGQKATLRASRQVGGLHFWSWGYGYLYTVKTSLVVNGKTVDSVLTRTGFRKTAYRDGMVYLNDRVLQLKGFAQRSTNEWPAVGISVPAWMSDYSNRLVLGCNGNFFRWMHVTPMKQDVESFDRLGLIQAMPAGDAEKDVADRRWQQRTEVMRDAIIYNRNNPSILFYECGNNQISEEHMAEMKKIRDQYDPMGGRAIGSRNMLDSKVAEYGGEMLYVNKSAGKPMFMMEYNRDEGIRRYWDEWSYPYHKEGEGPLYRGERAVAYNHNQDGLAVENIIRWNEYWLARPGQGRRVNSGGAKIIFSDSNTHARGEKNYRTSGDVDAMRIAKDSWFVHQAIWDGWVDTEKEHTYIIGHWNYEKNVVKPVYVASTADEVELFLNGKSLGKGERSNTFLFTFKDVKWEAGKLEAIGRTNGSERSRYALETVDQPVALKMHWVEAPEQFRADGSDIRIAEIEAVDKDGRRHPLAHDMVTFDVKGKGVYLGGVSGVVSEEEKAMNASAKPATEGEITAEGGHSKDTNGVLSKELMLEAGVIRVMVRSTTKAGDITLTAKAQGYKPASLTIKTVACPYLYGFYVDNKGKAVEANWASALPLYLERGETPSEPSYCQHYATIDVKQVEVPVNKEDARLMFDDNENNEKTAASAWKSDGKLENAWVRVTLARPAAISRISLRMDGFRRTSYPPAGLCRRQTGMGGLYRQDAGRLLYRHCRACEDRQLRNPHDRPRHRQGGLWLHDRAGCQEECLYQGFEVEYAEHHRDVVQREAMNRRNKLLLIIAFMWVSAAVAQPDIHVARFWGDRQAALSYTFDDGLLEHYTEVFPRLRQLGLKASFCIIGSKVGRDQKGTPCMTWQQLREMAADGQEISSHGFRHQSMEKLTGEALRYEVQHNDTLIYHNVGVFPRTYFPRQPQDR